MIFILNTILSVFSYSQQSPLLKGFSISECKENCFIEADIIKMELINNTLEIEAGVNLNCCGNLEGSFAYWTKDTLNLVIDNKADKNGISTSCSCNCYYVIKYQITGIESTPELLLINGDTIEENRDDAGWVNAESPVIKN